MCLISHPACVCIIMINMGKSGIYSHPGVFIEDHINRCLDLLEFYRKKCVAFENQEFEYAIKVCTALHDFGKCTKYFQDYILKNKKYNDGLSNHSLLSAVYTYYRLRELIEDEKLLAFAFVACKRHHSNPETFKVEFNLNHEIDKLKKQIESIDEDKVNIFISNLNLPEYIKERLYFRKDKFMGELGEVVKGLKNLRKNFRNKSSEIRDFLLFEYLFSLLLDADKTEAGAKTFKPHRIDLIPKSVVDKYKQEKLTSNRKIDNLREEAFRQVMEKDISLDHKVYSITLPTGMGKTLTGFAFALKLREKLLKEKGINARIIYSFPL